MEIFLYTYAEIYLAQVYYILLLQAFLSYI